MAALSLKRSAGRGGSRDSLRDLGKQTHIRHLLLHGHFYPVSCITETERMRAFLLLGRWMFPDSCCPLGVVKSRVHVLLRTLILRKSSARSSEAAHVARPWRDPPPRSPYVSGVSEGDAGAQGGLLDGDCQVCWASVSCGVSLRLRAFSRVSRHFKARQGAGLLYCLTGGLRSSRHCRCG